MSSFNNRVAVLLTSFNRKEKTLACIESLFKSNDFSASKYEMDLILTDDGSTDHTGSEVLKRFPETKVLQGDGNLYWAGGMRNSWREALKGDYDFYLLINDDTDLFPTCFDELSAMHEYSLKEYGRGGVYIGTVMDPETREFSYGGRIITNKWSFRTQVVIPDGKINNCHLGNANIMLISSEVVDSIGIFSDRYIHGKADNDYTLRAVEKKIPVLSSPGYCGYCEDNHPVISLEELKIRERIQYLKSPKGVEISGYMYFMRRFFPFRAPFVYISLWARVLFPFIPGVINRILKR